MRSHANFFLLCSLIVGLFLSLSTQSKSQTAVVFEVPDASPVPQAVNKNDAVRPGTIIGTVEDAFGDVVPGAIVVLESPTERKNSAANENGFFQFGGLAAGTTYRVTISARGFDPWVSPSVVLTQGEFFEIAGIHLKLEDAFASVTVTADQTEIATEQVQVAEKQRVFGLIPNFYVIYDSKNAVPMTTRLKYRVAMKVSVDPITYVGAMMMAGMNQAGDRPGYQQGWDGYAQRAGAAYADSVSSLMFGGAILPSLLHQDPRYFYQGTGTISSRLRHALSDPIICKGDNGHLQPNYSSMGGDLISSALSNLYYPSSDRGFKLVLNSFLISTGTRALSGVLQEFLVRKLTPSARKGSN